MLFKPLEDDTDLSTILCRALVMSFTEVAPGVHLIQGKYVEGFGYISSYVIIRAGEAIVVDPGTAGHPGKKTLDALESFGLNPRRDVAAILCTHCHPDHVGGAKRLHRSTHAPVLIGEADASILKRPSLFLKERLLLPPTGRLTMAFDRSPMRVNYPGIAPERVLQHGERLHIGDDEIVVINTRGHSAGHCVFYMPRDRILFSGDEVGQYPSDPRRFYVDLSGDLGARLEALDALAELEIDYLLPAHDVPYVHREVHAQLSGAADGIREFQQAVLRIVSSRGSADIEQICFDLTHAGNVSVPTGNPFLLPTTVRVTLHSLEQAGQAREDNGVWSPV